MEILKRAILALCLALVPATAKAANYYFSDCGCTPNNGFTEVAGGLVGGIGATCNGGACVDNVNGNPVLRTANCALFSTTACQTGCNSWSGAGNSPQNPFCLAPEDTYTYGVGSTGVRKSFENLMDGAGAELASGDTVYLCAGACDGQGSATWYLQPHLSLHQNKMVLFDPAIGTTTPGATIVNIQAFPGETVIISGDSNADYRYTLGTDADRFWDSYDPSASPSVYSGYRFTGFTVERFAERTVNIAQTVGGGMVFDKMTFQHNGAGGSIGNGAFVSSDGGPFSMGCTSTNPKRDSINGSLDSFATFIFGGNRTGAALTVQNSTIRYNCQIVSRSNGNCYDGSSFSSATAVENCDSVNSAAGLTFDNNTIYGVFGLQNGHQGRGWTWTNNTITDFFEGITMEENTQANVITDNNISCRGIYQTDAAGRCRTAIKVDDGDSGENNCNDTGTGTCDGGGTCPHCSNRNNLIARNKIWGANYYPASIGWLVGGITWMGHNASAYDGGASLGIIENNMIWFQQGSNSCSFSNDSSVIEGPLSIASNDPITVRNNTIWNSACPAYLATGFAANSGGTGAVAHVFTDNLIGFTHTYTGGGANTAEFQVDSSATGSTVASNDFSDGGEGSTVANINGTTYTCATVNSTPALGLGAGSGNFCSVPIFSSSSGSKTLWDLHLAGSQACINGGIAGATDDIDRQVRSAYPPTDVGADEWYPSGAAVPSKVSPPRP